MADPGNSAENQTVVTLVTRAAHGRSATVHQRRIALEQAPQAPARAVTRRARRAHAGGGLRANDTAHRHMCVVVVRIGDREQTFA